MRYLTIVVCLALWAAVHSWTASVPFKSLIERKFGKNFLLRYYRLIYNIFALVTILPTFVVYMTIEHRSIYFVDGLFGGLLLFAQAIGLLLMVIAVRQTGPLRFAGFRPQADITNGEVDNFIGTGIYSFVRHPIYTGTYMLFVFDPRMTDIKLLLYAILSIYILIGIHFEEKRLVWEFGDRYKRYRSRVPMLFPNPLRK